MFGAVLALIAIFVTWMIPSNYKSPILLAQKNNKTGTVVTVKLANTSATYNRTLSSSSLAGTSNNNDNLLNLNNELNNTNNNPNIISSDMIATSSATIESQEKAELLIEDSPSNNLLSSQKINMSFFNSNSPNSSFINHQDLTTTNSNYYSNTNSINESMF